MSSGSVERPDKHRCRGALEPLSPAGARNEQYWFARRRVVPVDFKPSFVLDNVKDFAGSTSRKLGRRVYGFDLPTIASIGRLDEHRLVLATDIDDQSSPIGIFEVHSLDFHDGGDAGGRQIFSDFAHITP